MSPTNLAGGAPFENISTSSDTPQNDKTTKRVFKFPKNSEDYVDPPENACVNVNSEKSQVDAVVTEENVRNEDNLRNVQSDQKLTTCNKPEATSSAEEI